MNMPQSLLDNLSYDEYLRYEIPPPAHVIAAKLVTRETMDEEVEQALETGKDDGLAEAKEDARSHIKDLVEICETFDAGNKKALDMLDDIKLKTKNAKMLAMLDELSGLIAPLTTSDQNTINDAQNF